MSKYDKDFFTSKGIAATDVEIKDMSCILSLIEKVQCCNKVEIFLLLYELGHHHGHRYNFFRVVESYMLTLKHVGVISHKTIEGVSYYVLNK